MAPNLNESMALIRNYFAGVEEQWVANSFDAFEFEDDDFKWSSGRVYVKNVNGKPEVLIAECPIEKLVFAVNNFDRFKTSVEEYANGLIPSVESVLSKLKL